MIECSSLSPRNESFTKPGGLHAVKKEKKYIIEAEKRINEVKEISYEDLEITKSKKIEPKIPFGILLEKGLISPGKILFDGRQRWFAKVRVDGSLISDRTKGSIHKVGAQVQGLNACNGWTFWHTDYKGTIVPIDTLRSLARSELNFIKHT